MLRIATLGMTTSGEQATNAHAVGARPVYRDADNRNLATATLSLDYAMLRIATLGMTTRRYARDYGDACDGIFLNSASAWGGSVFMSFRNSASCQICSCVSVLLKAGIGVRRMP